MTYILFIGAFLNKLKIHMPESRRNANVRIRIVVKCDSGNETLVY